MLTEKQNVVLNPLSKLEFLILNFQLKFKINREKIKKLIFCFSGKMNRNFLFDFF